MIPPRKPQSTLGSRAARLTAKVSHICPRWNLSSAAVEAECEADVATKINTPPAIKAAKKPARIPILAPTPTTCALPGSCFQLTRTAPQPDMKLRVKMTSRSTCAESSPMNGFHRSPAKNGAETPTHRPVINAIRRALSVMGESRGSGTVRPLSHRRFSDKGCGDLLDFCQHILRRLGHSMLPFSDIFRDGLHPPSKPELTQPKQSSRHQHPIRRSWRGEGIVANEVDQSGPKRSSRLDFISLPSLIMLPQGAQTSSHLLLSQFQKQSPGQKMLPKRFWLQNEAFMKEIPEPESCPGGLEREVAKWQNRVIRILPKAKGEAAGQDEFTHECDCGEHSSF